jgi:hypothetical protein
MLYTIEQSKYKSIMTAFAICDTRKILLVYKNWKQ